MKRRPGIGAIRKQRLEQERFKDKGTLLQENMFEQMSEQMQTFKTKLEEFAAKHRNEIRKDPQFRRQFQEMCSSIGVDPLASSKGFWSELLGVGDFYYELAVQVIEVCLATSHRNGGIITLAELKNRLVKSRSQMLKNQEISYDDILRALGKLKIFGAGFTVLNLRNTKNQGELVIRAIPGELSLDHTAVLGLAEKSGFVSRGSLKRELGWDDARSEQVLKELVRDGLAWIDEQSKPEFVYWFPSFFPQLQAVSNSEQ
nr:EOG090X09XM [Eulimnadia texana]